MSHRISKIITIALAIVATIMLAVASWTIYSVTAVPGPRPPARSAPPPGPSYPPAAASPDDLVAASRQVNVTDAAPDDLPMPPQAHQPRTITMPGNQQVTSYLFKGSQDVLESFYADALGRQGWQRVGRSTSGAAVFQIDGRSCTIEYKALPNGREARVQVFMIR